MKSNLIRIAVAVLFAAVVAPLPAQQPSPPRAIPPAQPPHEAPVDPATAVNYSIRIEWRQGGGPVRHLEVITTEGKVSLDSVLPERVKIDENEIPVTVKLQAELRVINEQKARVQLFLGRTFPYVTSTYAGSAGGRSSSFQQMSVGFASTVIASLGKPIVIQSDGTETVSLLVRRAEP